MGKPPRGSAPRIRKDIRVDPDLLAEIDGICAADPSATFTSIMEEGAQLWIARYRRQQKQKAKAEDPTTTE